MYTKQDSLVVMAHFEAAGLEVLGSVEGWHLHPVSLSGRTSGSTFFLKSTDGIVADEMPSGCLIVIPTDTPEAFRASAHQDLCFVLAQDPRTVFFDMINQLYLSAQTQGGVHPTAVIADDVILGDDVRIGPHVSIGPGCNIGARSEIRSGARLFQNIRVGEDCLIKSNAVLGEEGYGLYRSEDGRHQLIPHVGGVEIGDRVMVGATTVVCSGTLDPTRIGDDSKLDDHVFIAHNCQLGKNVAVIACAEVSGSARLRDDSWIGPSACILNQKDIGERALVGLGAVVTKDVPAGMIVAGNPAKVIRPRGDQDG